MYFRVHFWEQLELPDHLRGDQQTADKRADVARYEVAFGAAANGQLDVLGERLWLIDRANKPLNSANTRATLPPETLLNSNISGKKFPAGWRVVVEKSGGANTYYPKNGQDQLSFKLGFGKAALSGLPEDRERFATAIWVRDLLLEGIRVLALNSAAMRRPVSPSARRQFNVSGANLPLVIQDLAKDKQTYEDWLAHVQTVLPDVKKIHVYERAEDRHLYLAIEYTSAAEPVPSWLVSDGTLRLLALTLLAYLPDEPRIYLIEEPENGIHPKAVEGVFQSLSSVYRGQVMIASHSPLFLGLAEQEQLLIFAKDQAGAVSIVSGDQHPALANWRGHIRWEILPIIQ